MPTVSEKQADIERKRKMGVEPSARDYAELQDAQKKSEGQQSYGLTSSKFSGVLPNTTATTSTSVIGQSEHVSKSDHQHGQGTHTHADSTTGGTITSASVSDFAEATSDQIGAMVTSNTETGIAVTYDDADNTLDFVVDTEYIADTVGAMVAGNTETGISVTYDDADNTLDFVADAEYIADTVGAMVTGNTETNITVTYDDADNTLDFVVATATDSVKGVAVFPVTDFTVSAGSVTILEEKIQDIVGAMVSGGTETNIAVTYDDTNGRLDFVVPASTGAMPLQPTGDIVINETGGNFDLRWEGDTNTTLFNIDATDDTVSIGAAPVAEDSYLNGVFQVTYSGNNQSFSTHNNAAGFGSAFVNTVAESATSGAWIFEMADFIPSATEKRLGGIGFGAEYQAGLYYYGSAIECFSANAWSIGDKGASMRFSVVPSGSAVATEIFRVTGTGLQPELASFIINDAGNDHDVIIEGLSNVNLFTLDAGADAISIGATLPTTVTSILHVTAPASSSSVTGYTQTAGYGIYSMNSVAEGTTSGGVFVTRATFTPSTADKRIGAFVWDALEEGTTYRSGGRLEVFSEGAWADEDCPAYVVMKVTPDGSRSSAEAMRWQSDGMIRFSNATSWTANGTNAVTISNVAPAGVGTATISKWLTVTDNAGAVFYIPCFT